MTSYYHSMLCFYLASLPRHGHIYWSDIAYSTCIYVITIFCHTAWQTRMEGQAGDESLNTCSVSLT